MSTLSTENSSRDGLENVERTLKSIWSRLIDASSGGRVDLSIPQGIQETQVLLNNSPELLTRSRDFTCFLSTKAFQLLAVSTSTEVTDLFRKILVSCAKVLSKNMSPPVSGDCILFSASSLILEVTAAAAQDDVKYPVSCTLFLPNTPSESVSPFIVTLESVDQAKSLMEQLYLMLGDCKKYLEFEYPWFWEAWSREQKRLNIVPNPALMNAGLKVADACWEQNGRGLSHLESVLLALPPDSDQVSDLLDEYALSIEEERPIISDNFFGIAGRHSSNHPEQVCELLILAFGQEFPNSTGTCFAIPKNSEISIDEPEFTLHISLSLSTNSISQFGEDYFPWVFAALLASKKIRNPVPTLKQLLDHYSCAKILEPLVLAAPYLSPDISLFILAISIDAFSGFNKIDTSAILEWLSKTLKGVGIPSPSPDMACVAPAINCIRQLLDRVYLPEHVKNWCFQHMSQPHSNETGAPEVTEFSEQQFTPLRKLLLMSGIIELKKHLHPQWKRIVSDIASWEDDERRLRAFYFLTFLFDRPLQPFLESLSAYTIPCVLSSPSFAAFISKTLETTVESILTNYVYIWLPWILSEETVTPETRIAQVLTSVSSFKLKSIRDLILIGGVNLLVHLCLHRYEEGIRWLESQQPNNTSNFILDAALPLLIKLNDALLHNPWDPLFPSPIDALTTVAWLIGKLGSYVAMMASQVLALLSVVAHEYPEHVCKCWYAFVNAVDEETLSHFWSIILMACATRIPSSGMRSKFLDFLFTYRCKSFLLSAPDLPSSLEVYQRLIDDAKKGLSLSQRIEQVCDRISSTNLDVASASLDELNCVLKPLSAIPHCDRIVETLLSVLDRHPSLELKCANCLCTLGAVDAPPPQILTLSKGGTMTNSSLLPKEMIESCLLPSFRSSTNTISQILYAFAIQEVCKLSHDTQKDLSELDLATVRPLLKSKYNLTLPNSATASLSIPLFTRNMPLSVWACGMLRILSRICIEDPLSSILRAVQPLLTRPEEACPVALFLLPHVLFHMCRYHKDSVNLASDEFTCVLRQAQNDKSADPCANAIYMIIKQLTTWIYQNRAHRRVIEPIQFFLSLIPASYLADAAELIGRYDTSIFYLESMAAPSPETLFRVYAKKGEMDYALGASQLIEQKTMKHIALEHTVSNDWALVQSIYEASLVKDPGSLPHFIGLLNAMQELELFQTLLIQCNGAILQHAEWENRLNEYRIKACWKLGQWDMLDSYTKSEDHITSGHLIADLHRGHIKELEEHSKAFKLDLLDQFRMNLSPSVLVQFHFMADLMNFADTAKNLWLQEGYSAWQRRFERVPLEYRFREPILSACRSIFLQYSPRDPKWCELMGGLWLKSAKLAMKDRRKYASHSDLLHARDVLPKLPIIYHVHMSKWLAQYENVPAALTYVRTLNLAQTPLSPAVLAARDIFQDNPELGTDEHEIAHLHLMTSRWMDQTSDTNSETIMKTFSTACAFQPTWEKPFYFAGRYCHKLLNESTPESTQNYASQQQRLAEQVVMFYGKSLLLGARYTYEALPLLLAFWMDSATNALETPSSSPGFATIHKYIDSLIPHLPSYSLMVALPQVTSRLCHKRSEVVNVLTTYLLRCLNKYTSQTMWHLISSVQSKDPLRSSRTREILAIATSKNPQLEQCVSQVQKLCNLLMQVTNFSAPRDQSHFLLSSKCSALQKSINFDRVVLPMQRFILCELPSNHTHDLTHSAFNEPVYFHSFSDRVEIMSSMVRPKKLDVIGSNGQAYTFLCKPKDDLRKDARFIEFTNFIDRLLRKNRPSRDRNLRIRTYSVTPLSEECGIIEWIPRMSALRSILRPMYASRNIEIFNTEIQRMFRDTPEKLTPNFKKLLGMCPPVLQHWFAQSFPDPRTWFEARLNFTRTCAVMSMVGFVLGLGDRHCENILLDVESGDAMHVDFNCLFEKGKALAKPEIVPFRLTQNMVAAFGTAGLEGPFHKACEVTLTLLREHAESLMIVLESFLHDPLIEWKSKKRSQTDLTEDHMRNQAKKILQGIYDRLHGVVEHGAPLSVSGQVTELIRQATSLELLAQMYEGWLPHL